MRPPPAMPLPQASWPAKPAGAPHRAMAMPPGVDPAPPPRPAAARARRVTPVAPAALPSPAAAPAREPAAFRPGPLPGTPTPIPLQPRPRMIALGAMLMAVAVWALAAYLPGHAPNTGDRARAVSAELYYAGNVVAVALLAIGLFIALSAALHRAQTEVLCRVCHRQVIGWKESFGLLCPIDKHYARIDWLALVVTVGFWLLSLGFLAVLAVLLYA